MRASRTWYGDSMFTFSPASKRRMMSSPASKRDGRVRSDCPIAPN